MLQFFKRHSIGQPIPLSPKTLLNTPRDVKFAKYQI